MNAHSAELSGKARAAAECKAKEDAGQLAIPLGEESRGDLIEDKTDIEAPSETADLPPGRALALADFGPPSVSAGERLMRLAFGLGVAHSTIVAPFRKPQRPRLLATVSPRLPGDRAAGMALRAGHFYICGVKAPFAQVDMGPLGNLSPPFERVVHGFTWLRDLASSGTPPQCRQVGERLLMSWIEANPVEGKGPAWKVENVGLRLMSWLVHAPLLISPDNRELRFRMLVFMSDTARWLDRNAGKADDRLGEIAGWCAVVAAGLLLPQGKPRRLYGEAGLAKALGEAMGEDGGLLSRSPDAQMQAIASLIDLSACYQAAECEPPQMLRTMLHLLVPPLLALRHGDGGLGNWQGGGATNAARLNTLIAASGVRTRPLKDPGSWGYQRVTARKATLMFDGSPPPFGKHARHGCASTLAFEFSHGDHRLIVNCGGAGLAGGQVPVRIEQGLRATAAHSTLVLGDANSTAVLIDGKLGNGVGEVAIDTREVKLENGAATRIEASHDGYAGRFGLLHRRILMLRDDGQELRGEDVLEPSGRKGKRGKVPFAIRFHLGRHVEATLGENGRNASLLLPDGSLWQFVSGAEGLLLEESLWVDGNGKPHPVQQLVIEGFASRGGGNFSWLLKRMG
ncbi:heparinase II/III family protein [Aurantiacibacter poecillastricola]|uniref:heparinase II/III family protein n=1 Tax=Aurantiacibacter poecillastricola TaxID=3064385 RepID=UPI00273E2749|nr:heparinase II/III-family protein [Aurantiacibacter sp. 219JJ12-13]MDP5260632.1 heparinase II/III-family protein [Aurantiacibacter sp. 219JJ12-13]